MQQSRMHPVDMRGITTQLDTTTVDSLLAVLRCKDSRWTGSRERRRHLTATGGRCHFFSLAVMNNTTPCANFLVLQKLDGVDAIVFGM